MGRAGDDAADRLPAVGGAPFLLAHPPWIGGRPADRAPWEAACGGRDQSRFDNRIGRHRRAAVVLARRTRASRSCSSRPRPTHRSSATSRSCLMAGFSTRSTTGHSRPSDLCVTDPPRSSSRTPAPCRGFQTGTAVAGHPAPDETPPSLPSSSPSPSSPPRRRPSDRSPITSRATRARSSASPTSTRTATSTSSRTPPGST